MLVFAIGNGSAAFLKRAVASPASSSEGQPHGLVMLMFSHIAVACASARKNSLLWCMVNELLCNLRIEVSANQISAHCMLKPVFLALFTGWWLTGGVIMGLGAFPAHLFPS